MASVSYEKVVSFPVGTQIPATKGVVGTPYSTVFNPTLLNAMFEVIKMLKTMEAAVAEQGFTHVTAMDLGTDYEQVFTTTETLADLGNQLLISGWTGTSANGTIPAARRHYKIGDAETTPLYMLIEMGMRGYAATEGGVAYFSRFYVSLIFANNPSFTSVVYERNLTTTMAANAIYSPGGNFNGKLAFILTENNLALYPCPVPLYDYHNFKSYHGKIANTASYNYFNGVLLAKAKAYIPTSPMQYVMTAFLGPQANGVNTSDGTYATAFLANYLYTGGFIVTPDGYEQRGLCAPPTAVIGNATQAARKFAAPFFYVSGTGTVYECQDVFWINDPARDRMDIASAMVNYAGQSFEVVALPCLNTMALDSSGWATHCQSFVMGLKI